MFSLVVSVMCFGVVMSLCAAGGHQRTGQQISKWGHALHGLSRWDQAGMATETHPMVPQELLDAIAEHMAVVKDITVNVTNTFPSMVWVFAYKQSDRQEVARLFLNQDMQAGMLSNSRAFDLYSPYGTMKLPADDDLWIYVIPVTPTGEGINVESYPLLPSFVANVGAHDLRDIGEITIKSEYPHGVLLVLSDARGPRIKIKMREIVSPE